MKKILVLALFSFSSISFASELSHLNGDYQLTTGDKNCFETLNIAISEKGINLYGDLVNEIINADLSDINTGKKEIRNSTEHGFYKIDFDEENSTLGYFEKGRQSLTEDGLGVIPYRIELGLKQNTDGSLDMNFKSINIFSARSIKNMSCVYSK